MGSLVRENCWRWVRERDLDAFLRWGMKKCSRRSELSLWSLVLQRLCCWSGNPTRSAIGVSANERLLSRAWRQKQIQNTTT